MDPAGSGTSWLRMWPGGSDPLSGHWALAPGPAAGPCPPVRPRALGPRLLVPGPWASGPGPGPLGPGSWSWALVLGPWVRGPRAQGPQKATPDTYLG